MKSKILVIGILFVLLNSFFVLAGSIGEEELKNARPENIQQVTGREAIIGESPSLIDWILSLFKTTDAGRMTDVGNARGCSDGADEYSYFGAASDGWYGKDAGKSSVKITCSGEPALINVFSIKSSGSWSFIYEKEAPYSLSNVDKDRVFAYQCYYCPYKACTSDSFCKSNGYGNKCNKNGGICYTEQCEEDWECDSWGSCENGYQWRDCDDDNNCGTVEDRPTQSRSCTSTETYKCTDSDGGDITKKGIAYLYKNNQNIDSKTDSCSGNSLTEYFCVSSTSKSISSRGSTCVYGCSNGACKSAPSTPTTPTTPTTPPSTTKPNFKVEFVETPSKVKADEDTTIKVKITNEGASGYMNVEAGIYEDKFYEGVGTRKGYEEIVPNCKVSEKFVQTKRINLNAGESITTSFTFKVPKYCGTFSLTSDAFEFVVVPYESCHYENGASGATDIVKRDVIVDLDWDIWCGDGTCEDGIKNQDESNIDCGGECVPCKRYEPCNSKDDCEKPLSCINSICDYSGADGKQVPLTVSEWNSATHSQIINSMCESTSECGEKDGYSVKCETSEEIYNKNKDATYYEGGIWDDIKTLFKFTKIPDGTCRATKEKAITIGGYELSYTTMAIIGIILFLAYLLTQRRQSPLIILGGSRRRKR